VVSLPPAPPGPPEPFPSGGVPGPAPFPPGGDPPRAESRRWTIVLIVVAALVVAGAGVALMGSGNDGTGASSPPPGSATNPPTAPAPAAPAALKADAGSFKVTLAWMTGDPSAPVGYWLITRDGRSVGEVSGSKRAWTDTHAIPHADYAYEVVAVTEDGQRSPASRVTVRTLAAPPATSRLAGLFDVRLVPTSRWGFSTFHDGPTSGGWNFKPTCQKGACDTQLGDSGVDGMKVVLDRMPASYQGTVTAHSLVTCGGTHVATSVVFDLHVTQADEVGGVWRATKIEGTMTQRSASQLGCVSSGVDYTVAGSLVH